MSAFLMEGKPLLHLQKAYKSCDRTGTLTDKKTDEASMPHLLNVYTCRPGCWRPPITSLNDAQGLHLIGAGAPFQVSWVYINI